MQQKPAYNEIKYEAPYRGWNTQAPENLIPASDSPYLQNFMLRNAEIRSFPRMIQGVPYLPTKQPIRGVNSFIDNNGYHHTVAFTDSDLWQLIYNQNRQWLWNRVASFNGSGQPYASHVFLNKIYWTSLTPGVYYWDGIKREPELSTAYFGAKFLGELGFHLLLLNTIEVEATEVVNYRQRIRWTPSGLINVWDPAVNMGAGYNDQIDVPDEITGYLNIGKNGFIFRTNGITQMSLTGRAAAPFSFDHLWASDRGIGNIYPYSIASYGSLGIFISREEVYKISASNFEPIGMGARDQIFNDLDSSIAAPIAYITSGYHKRFVYLAYHLFIPVYNGCIVWIYNLEDKNWTRRFIRDMFPTGKMSIVPTR